MPPSRRPSATGPTHSSTIRLIATSSTRRSITSTPGHVTRWRRERPGEWASSGGARRLSYRLDFGPQSTSEGPSSTILNDTVHNRSQAAGAEQSPAAILVRVEGGFDWISAAVGAAGGSGLLLVLGVATVALRRREHIDAAQA